MPSTTSTQRTRAISARRRPAQVPSAMISWSRWVAVSSASVTAASGAGRGTRRGTFGRSIFSAGSSAR
ncbi:MAG: hypothetical protein QM650_02770 [Microlunatus sp.]